jgi:hypothetical protein
MKIALRFSLATVVAVIWYLTFAYLPFWTIDGYTKGSFTMMWTALNTNDFSIAVSIVILFPALILSIIFNWKAILNYSIFIYALNMLYILLKAASSSGLEMCYGFYVHTILMFVVPLFIYGGLISYSQQKPEDIIEIIEDKNSVQPTTQVENEIEKKERENDSFSLADELSKYAKLKDDGHITQEEFDKKKKELL